MTLREAHLGAARILAERPELREHAARDAERLLLYALGLSRAAFHAHPDLPVSSARQEQLKILIDRRLTHEPMQYILGEQEFFGLVFHVTAATLIPRPETELLVEAILERFPASSAPRIVDVGTGSGAIAVALAHHRPAARILALDLSPSALSIAQQNARTHSVGDQIKFLESDLLAALPSGFQPDAIVSNPPYVPETDRPALHPQVRDHEPAMALFAGADGLSLYRRLIPQARQALGPLGLLAVEFGFGQAGALEELLEDWTSVEFLSDLQGISRVALAKRPA